jgi:hypothetical protein
MGRSELPMLLVAIEELEVDAFVLLCYDRFSAIGDAKVPGLWVFNAARVFQVRKGPANPVGEAGLTAAR